MKSSLITACLASAFLVMPCVAQQPIFDCIRGTNASWSDEESWVNRVVPGEGMMAIVNGGSSGIVDEPFEAPISVQVGNGTSEPPDGTLTIDADFRVKSLAVATHDQTSGRIEHGAGVLSVEELSLASTVPEAREATYDLIEGRIEAETLKVGMTGPGVFNLKGSGEVVTVYATLEIGPQGVFRFMGDKTGFPVVNASGEVTIEPGASLIVEAAGSGAKSGTFTLIQADQPLSSSFVVELVNFAEGQAKVLENEPGVVLEVK